MRFNKVPLLVFLSCSSTMVNAQLDMQSAEVQAAIRVQYENSSDLPSGVAFASTLRRVRSYYEEDPAVAIEAVGREMGLNSVEANDFVNHAVTTINAIDSEISQVSVDLACDAKAYDRDAYKVLEKMDDTYEEINDRHFQETKKMLGDEGGSRLQGWIDSQKLHITHIKFDHKKLDQISGGDGDNALTKLCSGDQ